MKILLIDDDAPLLNAVKRMLEHNDHEVDAANGADAGIERLSEKTYDFILVDYKMPEKDGIWFMGNAKIPHGTKVMLMTAFVNRGVINEMFKLGISGYLIKPFGEEEILRHLSFHDGGGSA